MYTPGLDVCNLESPFSPLFAAVILTEVVLLLVQRVSHGKSLGRSRLRFMTLSAPFVVVASVFPFRQIKMGTLVLIMNRMTMLFFFLRNDAFINVVGRKPTYQVA